MTQDELLQIVNYDPETGIFTWARNNGKARIGKIAGSKNRHGYVNITINRVRYYAHRLAFLYMEGFMPPLVDHKDQCTSNNAWCNLRDASKSLNAFNSKMRHNNASGLGGVSWHARGGKWQAHCGPKYLGLFEDKHVAHAAYLTALEQAA